MKKSFEEFKKTAENELRAVREQAAIREEDNARLKKENEEHQRQREVIAKNYVCGLEDEGNDSPPPDDVHEQDEDEDRAN